MVFMLIKFLFVCLKKLLNFFVDDYFRVVFMFMKDRSGLDYINVNYIDVCI